MFFSSLVRFRCWLSPLGEMHTIDLFTQRHPSNPRRIKPTSISFPILVSLMSTVSLSVLLQQTFSSISARKKLHCKLFELFGCLVLKTKLMQFNLYAILERHKVRIVLEGWLRTSLVNSHFIHCALLPKRWVSIWTKPRTTVNFLLLHTFLLCHPIYVCLSR